MWIQRSGQGFRFLPWQVFPEGLMSSCRADISDTLAQNGHCELWKWNYSGMYRTCKKQLGHLKRLDKVFEGKPHARSDWMFVEMVMSKSLKERFRLRKPYKSRSHQKTKFDVPVLGLARCHGRKLEKGNCRYPDWRPNLYHQIKWVVFVGSGPKWFAATPCLF